VRAEASGLDADRPKLAVERSREYAERVEAEAIFAVLKGIVATATGPSDRNHPTAS
jgi:hypothetical protein